MIWRIRVQRIVQFSAKSWSLRQIIEFVSGGQAGVGTGVPHRCVVWPVISLSFYPGPSSNCQNMVRWWCIVWFACFVIPLYLKQMETVALEQIDSSWNEKDLYPSECWCRNKWKKNMLVGSWSSLNWYFFFFKGRWGFFPLPPISPLRELFR